MNEVKYSDMLYCIHETCTIDCSRLEWTTEDCNTVHFPARYMRVQESIVRYRRAQEATMRVYYRGEVVQYRSVHDSAVLYGEVRRIVR